MCKIGIQFDFLKFQSSKNIVIIIDMSKRIQSLTNENIALKKENKQLKEQINK